MSSYLSDYTDRRFRRRLKGSWFFPSDFWPTTFYGRVGVLASFQFSCRSKKIFRSNMPRSNHPAQSYLCVCISTLAKFNPRQKGWKTRNEIDTKTFKCLRISSVFYKAKFFRGEILQRSYAIFLHFCHFLHFIFPNIWH